MIALVLSCLLLVEEPKPVQKPLHPSMVKRVEAARTFLEGDEVLLAQHQGYLGWLSAHPEIAEREEAWWDVLVLAEPRRLAGAFDETLMGDVLAQHLFDQFYDELHRNPELRAQVDTLQHLEWNITALDGALSKGMGKVKATPQESLEQIAALGEGIEGGTAGELLQHLAENPDLLKGLQQLLGGLSEDNNFFVRVLPWWKAMNTRSGNWRGPYQSLQTHFARFPHRFWIWHKRQIALAGDAHARSWVRHWFREVRRQPELKEDYALLLRQDFADGRYAEEEVVDWPPKAAPPLLKPLPEKALRPAPSKIERPRAGVKPGVERPTSPVVSPRYPVRPTKPVAPDPELAGPPKVKTERTGSTVEPLVRPKRPTPPMRPKSSTTP